MDYKLEKNIRDELNARRMDGTFSSEDTEIESSLDRIREDKMDDMQYYLNKFISGEFTWRYYSRDHLSVMISEISNNELNNLAEIYKINKISRLGKNIKIDLITIDESDDDYEAYMNRGDMIMEPEKFTAQGNTDTCTGSINPTTLTMEQKQKILEGLSKLIKSDFEWYLANSTGNVILQFDDFNEFDMMRLSKHYKILRIAHHKSRVEMEIAKCTDK